VSAVDLAAIYEEGRLAWPGVELDRRSFERFARERGALDHEGVAACGPDLYLACACLNGDAAALAVFERRYLAQVPMFLAKSNAPPHFVDDVRQLLRERLFVDGKIAQYTGRGTLGSWLRVVTLRVASDVRRQGRPNVELDEALPADAIDPTLGVIRRRYRDDFRNALRDALQALRPEDRSVLRLFYQEGLNLERIAAVLHVSRATIGRRMITLRERLVKDTHRLLRTRLRATSAELESLLRCLRSDLAMSLSVLFRESEGGRPGES
jgi:RNA polymerase sigma-70 factor, ECF subfamily